MKEIEIIKNETVVELPMSGYFYSRLLQVTQNLVKDKTDTEMKEAFKQIQSKTITDAWVSDLETMFIICKDFEAKARAGNFIEKQEIEETQDS
jgi:hypothetical protein